MSKKNETSVESLQAELKAEREKSDRLQRDSEDRQRKADEEARAQARETERVRADARAAESAEPSPEQWEKLELEYGMPKEQIKSSWKIAQKVAGPLHAKISAYETRDAASEAVRTAKAAAAANDAQFPKYEAHVDEYLADLSVAEKADPARLAKHMDRALMFAQGKARKSGTFRDNEQHDQTRDSLTQEQRDDAKAGFGSHEISGLPLTIDVQKRVPDDFRKLHADPEKEGAVRMNERSKWNSSVPVKPR